MLEDYGDHPMDKFPSRFGGKPSHERNEFLSEYQKPLRSNRLEY